jgi:dTDP-4-dehydrorhamnose reductase
LVVGAAEGQSVKFLVTGAGGQVGREVVELLHGESVVALDRATCDVGDRPKVLAVVESERPDAIVNCGAWTAVDACESDPERAFRVNAMGVRNVGEAARRVGSYVVTVSTDYVFDGTKPEPYDEWDQPNPQSVYGRSKRAGEVEVDPGSAVVRTSWVCGRYGANMVKTILRLSGEHEKLSFVADQRGHPTIAADLASMLCMFARERLPGMWHVTNQGAVSWYEFAQAVLTADGDDPARVGPITTDDLQPPRPAPRPANSVLDNRALRLAGIDALPDFHESLARVVSQIRGAE